MELRNRAWRLGFLIVLLIVVVLLSSGLVVGEEEGEESRIQSALLRNDGASSWRRWIGGLAKAADECEEQYGIMPCSTSLGGNAALLVIYGFALLKAAQLLSEGSELLLTVMSPGIVGGLVLPILGAFPDALLITVSGLGASQAEAQKEVLVGMGLVAGSSVMVLTALWGSCLIVGRCDLVPNASGKLVAKDRTLTRGFHLTETGVTTDQQTKWASWIMMATLLPYIVAQIPRLFGLDAAGHLCIAIAAFIAVGSLIAYCTYQLASPWLQEKRVYWAHHRFRKSQALQKVSQLTHQNNWGSIFNADGKPNEGVLMRLFAFFDPDKDEVLTEGELKGLIVGLGIERHNGKIPEEEEIEHWMKEFDISKDGLISKGEFLEGIGRWIRSSNASFSKKSGSSSGGPPVPHTFWDAEAQNAKSDLTALLEDQEDEDEDEEGAGTPSRAQTIVKAICYLIAGAAVAAIFADPLVDAIGGFSTASGISPFFISFIATPLATNSSEAISSVLFARRKRKRSISMTYSQIYGAVTMNNTMCLGIFLAIVYFRGLLWDFSAEISVILFATVIMGGVAAVRTTFPLWMAYIGLALYPASIGLVAFLDYVCGWH